MTVLGDEDEVIPYLGHSNVLRLSLSIPLLTRVLRYALPLYPSISVRVSGSCSTPSPYNNYLNRILVSLFLETILGCMLYVPCVHYRFPPRIRVTALSRDHSSGTVSWRSLICRAYVKIVNTTQSRADTLSLLSIEIITAKTITPPRLVSADLKNNNNNNNIQK
ncbi:GSCOCG00001583001-RA-CDS [Cotesia congregata]|nr:GSCOCG00001583001-RA-CDS [Cotesia congregata]